MFVWVGHGCQARCRARWELATICPQGGSEGPPNTFPGHPELRDTKKVVRSPTTASSGTSTRRTAWPVQPKPAVESISPKDARRTRPVRFPGGGLHPVCATGRTTRTRRTGRSRGCFACAGALWDTRRAPTRLSSSFAGYDDLPVADAGGHRLSYFAGSAAGLPPLPAIVNIPEGRVSTAPASDNFR
jgi:hypothetical protein